MLHTEAHKRPADGGAFVVLGAWPLDDQSDRDDRGQ